MTEPTATELVEGMIGKALAEAEPGITDAERAARRAEFRKEFEAFDRCMEAFGMAEWQHARRRDPEGFYKAKLKLSGDHASIDISLNPERDQLVIALHWEHAPWQRFSYPPVDQSPLFDLDAPAPEFVTLIDNGPDPRPRPVPVTAAISIRLLRELEEEDDREPFRRAAWMIIREAERLSGRSFSIEVLTNRAAYKRMTEET